MSSARPAPLHALAALALCVFAFFMAAWVSRVVFERLPHLEDEVAYVFQARVFARGDFMLTTPEPRRALWQPFVLDDRNTGNRFSKYTPGWSLALAIGEAWGQAWWVNAVMAALAVALVYRLGAEIWNEDVGLVASALVAFSPAALLLNATLMAHTAAFLYTCAFVYAYWRIERGKHMLVWGTLAGLMLGLLVITRPATALAVSAPFVAWSGVRLLRDFVRLRDWRLSLRQVSPLLVLAGITLLLSRVTPLYNQAAVGDPNANLYTLVWNYDRIGFGEGYGRNGHTLEKAFRHARFDLSLTAADLFGWNIGGISPQVREDLLTRANYYRNTGLSFLLLPLGICGGFLWGVAHWRRGALRGAGLLLWTLGALAWCLLPIRYLPIEQIQNPLFSWLWIVGGLAWVYLPILALAWIASPQARYTWLMTALMLGLVIIQMTYWIGSQRYSTRYWYEALLGAAFLTALPIAWLIQRNYVLRVLSYAGFAILLMVTLVGYSEARISVLYGFNNISQRLIEQIKARQVDEQPLLVIINGESTGDNRVRWNAYGALMWASSPYLDSEIVYARDSGSLREAILARFPERQIIEMQAQGDSIRFIDEDGG